jgi:hypothetical protein
MEEHHALVSATSIAPLTATNRAEPDSSDAIDILVPYTSAAHRVLQHTTRLSHAMRGQGRYAAPKMRSGKSMKVVEVHNTVTGNSVGEDSQFQF